jgi:hypothetical protein
MFSTRFILQSAAPQVPAPVMPAKGSQRKRVWDLPSHVHCPVIGVCLPLAALRRLAQKAAPEVGRLDDYALHSAAVQYGRSRNALSEALQDELELRHSLIVKQVRKLRERPALAQKWAEAVAAGEIAGALWAILTHPACDVDLSEQLSQHLHMLQHQAGASLRLDIARFNAVMDENATLARALAAAQQRCERFAQEKKGEIEALSSRLLRERGELIRKDGQLAGQTEELARLRAIRPDAEALCALEQQLVWQQDRAARLSLENARLRKQLAERAAPVPVPMLPAPVASVAASGAAEVALEGQRILCVGGRESVVVVYRKLIEQAGGRFLHHDGGLEDRFAQLDSALGSADLVICQTGCISHNAYWRVKDHCKRTGKRCAFVETPSAAGLARGLRCLLADALAEGGNENQNVPIDAAMSVGFQQT